MEATRLRCSVLIQPDDRKRKSQSLRLGSNAIIIYCMAWFVRSMFVHSTAVIWVLGSFRPIETINIMANVGVWGRLTGSRWIRHSVDQAPRWLQCPAADESTINGETDLNSVNMLPLKISGIQTKEYDGRRQEKEDIVCRAKVCCNLGAVPISPKRPS